MKIRDIISTIMNRHISTGRRDHIVPRQMIKRFADNYGNLWELVKPELKIGTRRRKPKSVLFREDYYKDEVGDLDEELLKPIENRFQRYYPKLADESWSEKIWPAEIGSAFIDWVASLMCRTQMLVAMTRIASSENCPLMFKILNILTPKSLDNLFRSIWFCEHQDFLTRPDFKWKCLNITTDKNIIITDNPVILSGNLGAGTVIIVPLGKRRIIFGGKPDALEPWGSVSVDLINLLLGGHAQRHIFAADKDTLEILVNNLNGVGEYGPDEFCEAARKPLFGLPERILNKCSSGTIDTSKAWEELKDGYGESIIKKKNNNCVNQH
jgi:hypothetical protein